MPLLHDFLPTSSSEDAIVEGFIAAQAEVGRTLYPHQEEALLAIAAGDHVIAATPTGSGKTTIAYAALYAAMARGETAYYTAPIKALVSEKFFEIVSMFGAENVGMMTGDSSVNHEAPIIVCTAEILANHALRDGETSDIGLVVMDEFHFYDDSQRGWAWQVPLIELPRTQFVLMSATLGDVTFFEKDLATRTGRSVNTIAGAERPVPLDFRWATTDLPETITEILDNHDAPVYIVHFTQKDALEQAQHLLGTKILTKDEKAQVRELIGDFRFSRGFGSILSKLVREGIGVHHAGMLPKYRRLVERLAQSGLLKVIAGTDTLGVGINVPIRTVLMTGLAKFDGRRQRLLNTREFLQIAGRAGRAGYDTVGHVVVQAPEWAVEFEKEKERFAKRAERGATPNNAKKKKQREPKMRIPEGRVNWTEDNLRKLSEEQPSALKPHMAMTSSILLALISRPGSALKAAQHLIDESHQSRAQKFALKRRALELFRGLKEAEIITVREEPDHLGRTVTLVDDLQWDFQMNQPLAAFAIAALDILDEDSPTLTMDSVSIIEAILEDPFQILLAQQNAAKSALLAELKADGVDYTERMARLDEITWPKPLEEELIAALEIYAKNRPWINVHDLSPKKIVREFYETGATFSEFVSRYQLMRSEGIVLRYLSDAYQALKRTLPVELRTEELEDVIEWLGVLVRGVDSSLLDEWEALTNPDSDTDAASEVRPDSPRSLSAQTKVLTQMVRAAMWRRVEDFAFEREEQLGELDGASGWDADRWGEAMDDFYDAHDHVVIEDRARAHQYLRIEQESKRWLVTQTIVDPEGDHDFVMQAIVDLEQTDEEGELALTLEYVGDIVKAPWR